MLIKLIPQYTDRYYNFTEDEFRCKDNLFGKSGPEFCNRQLHPAGINPLVLEGIQFIREYFKQPIIITSPYRCLGYNRSLGSGDSSQHPKGTAVDIQVANTRCEEVMGVVEDYFLFTGRGLYPDDNFCHLDVRDGLLALAHTPIARWVKKDGIYRDVKSFDKWGV